MKTSADRVHAELLSKLAAGNDMERERAADEVTDVHRSFGEAQASSLVQALVQARLTEAVERCQEAQLNALIELKAWHSFDRGLLSPLLSLRTPELRGDQIEYLRELTDR